MIRALWSSLMFDLMYCGTSNITKVPPPRLVPYVWTDHVTLEAVHQCILSMFLMFSNKFGLIKVWEDCLPFGLSKIPTIGTHIFRNLRYLELLLFEKRAFDTWFLGHLWLTGKPITDFSRTEHFTIWVLHDIITHFSMGVCRCITIYISLAETTAMGKMTDRATGHNYIIWNHSEYPMTTEQKNESSKAAASMLNVFQSGGFNISTPPEGLSLLIV